MTRRRPCNAVQSCDGVGAVEDIGREVESGGQAMEQVQLVLEAEKLRSTALAKEVQNVVNDIECWTTSSRGTRVP